MASTRKKELATARKKELMASSIHPDYPIRRLPRRSRIQAVSDPYAWERSVRKNVQRGTGAPVLLGRMSWKGHGASPGNREKKAEERAMRRQKGQALKNMKERAKDADRRDMDRFFWNRETVQTRRERTSPRAKAARRRGATEAQIDAKSRERQRQAIELGKQKKREEVWEQLPPGNETIAWDSMSPEEQDKLIREFNI